MAAIFVDGMDHYAVADTGLKYKGPGSGNWQSMQTGLLGTGQCGRLNNAAGPQLPLPSALATLVFGFRYRITGGVVLTPMLWLLDSSLNIIATLSVTATGQLAWYLGNQSTQVVASSAGLIVNSAINYIEAKVTLATGATGTIQVRMNGSDAIASTGSVQTANTTASASYLQFRSVGNTNDYDDFYVFDTTGSQNNTFAGDSKIVTVMPNGAGRLTQWTPLSGANYTNVNETTPNGDTSYVSSATAGQVDAYALASAGSPTSVKCVQINTDVRKDDAATRTIAHGVGNGTTENFDAGTNVGTTYGYLVRTLDTNPLTAAAWATGDLSTLQSAIKCIA